MYEIWLVVNIVWEIARANAVPVVFGVLVLLALALNALRRRGTAWKRAFVPALALGAVVAAVAVVAIPASTRSSLGDMAYWVDWLNLFAVAGAVGAIAAAYAWPLIAIVRGARA